MKSGIPWHVKGVRPHTRETAREAARRSGMSVGQWLDTVIIDSAVQEGIEPGRRAQAEPPPDEFGPQPRDVRPPRRMEDERYRDHDDSFVPKHRRYAEPDERQRLAASPDYAPPMDRPTGPLDRVQPAIHQDFAALNHRLDSLTHQLDHLTRLNAAKAAMPQAAVRDDDASHQLAAVVSKLDRRLDQLVGPRESEQRTSVVDRPAVEPNREPPRQPLRTDPRTPLDQALMEIADRQRALDGDGPVPAAVPPTAARTVGQTPPASEPLPRARTQEFAALERELRQINQGLETLRIPCGIDKAVDTLRDDLAEIGVMLQEAMPRKAVEALEAELRRLSERVEQTRHAGTDGSMLAGLERGLAEVRDALHALTPAENLVGFNDAVAQLSHKIDLLAGHSQDPAAFKQLEDAIVAMRGIVSHVASNDALAMLSDEVRALTAKVDRITSGGSSEVISSLERRIATLADALEARNRSGQDVPREFDAVVKGLIDKIERIQLTRGDHSVGHLEERIISLVEKLDASDARLNQLEAIERGLAELLIHLEHQRVPGLVRGGAEATPGVSAIERDLADLKQTDKKTQDTLEAVYGTLGLMVDRLATIETDLRERSAPAAAAWTQLPASQLATPAGVAPPPAVQPTAAKPIAEIAARSAAADPQPNAPAPAREPAREPAEFAPTQARIAPQAAERRPIDPNLPPDHPLEPGFNTTRARNSGSPADRIAASEAALGPARPPVIPDPGGKANFIAAARRAAQAAAREAPARNAPSTAPAAAPSAMGRLTSLWNTHRRSLIVGVSIIVIVAGMLHIATRWLSSSTEPESGAASEAPASNSTAASPSAATAPAVADENPLPPPAPPGRQSNLGPDTGSPLSATPSPGAALAVEVARQAMAATAKPAGPEAAAEREVTGSVQPPRKPPAAHPAPAAAPAAIAVAPPAAQPIPAAPVPALVPAPAHGPDKLPTVFSAALRAAAIHGEAAAQYEIAVRFAEGRGVPQDLSAAALWFERAANQGLVPAQFRLGGLHEKGLGIKKNLEAARRLYLGAGEAGNAKALHNLAVLYAEGIDGKPDYQSAAKWFRKAAGYGVADSQYNLAILYARGIGLEQNLVEAYRWFALAGLNGDQEAVKKRDDVAGRLDPASLAAAQRAAETFRPEAQPEAAIEVKAPPGGWDAAAAAPAGGKRNPRTAGPKLDLSTPRAAR